MRRRLGTFFCVIATASCGGTADFPVAPPTGDAATGSTDWPDQWSADITWSDFLDGAVKTNTWTGKVSYDWGLRAMRTDVVPPPMGTVPGPPIAEEGSMLMRDGHLYFITRAGGCTHEAAFGALRPNWVSAVNAQRGDPSPLAVDDARWTVDLARFDAGLAGCFNYVVDHTGRPKQFGGSASCSDWPKGSYIEYANFQAQRVSPTLFAIPANCPRDAVDPVRSQGCHGCHD